MRVLITGKTGFIANAVIAHFARFPGDFDAACPSVRNDSSRKSGFGGYDAVIHTAGIAHVRPDPSLEGEYMRINRDLAIDIARQAKADGVRHFIFISSIIVYGDASPAGQQNIIGPDTPPAPTGAYGRSKLEAEKGILALQDATFTVSVIRPPMVYGKGCKGNYNMLARLARKMPFFPDFPNNRSVLYVGNLAECIRRILKDGSGGIFFPQDERITSTSDLVRRISQYHKKNIRFIRCLNPLVRLMGRRGIVRRAFGDMAYDPSMSIAPGNYRIYDPDASIRNTEIQ